MSDYLGRLCGLRQLVDSLSNSRIDALVIPDSFVGCSNRRAFLSSLLLGIG